MTSKGEIKIIPAGKEREEEYEKLDVEGGYAEGVVPSDIDTETKASFVFAPGGGFKIEAEEGREVPVEGKLIYEGGNGK